MEEKQQDKSVINPLRSHLPTVHGGFPTFKLRILAPALGQLQHHEPLGTNERHMVLGGAQQRLVHLEKGRVYAQKGLKTEMLQ